jgi:hypothetical protein
MCRVGLASVMLAAHVVVSSVAFAQCNPGQINDPSTYQGSLCNQEQ